MKIPFNRFRRKDFLDFRHWSGKGYSLFATFGKIVRISVLSFAYFLVVPVPSEAEERDTSEVKMQFDLDEIEVTASRAPAVYSSIVRVLTVIDAKEIEHAPAESVQDLLEYVAAVDIRQRGAVGVQADISIRGGTFDQTVILLNGINITDPQTGHHNLNIPVSLSQVERIEVLEGPAARVFGPSAFSGAVNIVTKQPEGNMVSARISAGNFGYLHPGLSGGFQTGKWSHYMAGSYKKSEGYIVNTDFDISNGFYSGQMKTEKGDFHVQLGISEKAFGAQNFYTPQYPNQFEKTKTYFSSARWESIGPLHFSPAVYWRRHADKFMLFRDNPPGWYTSHNYHQTDSYGGNLNSWISWIGGKTALGAEMRSESILSNVLGEPLESPVPVPGGEAFYSKSKRRVTTSLFVDHSAYLGDFSLSAGVMANHISDNPKGLRFFPGMDAGYQVKPEVKLVASLNTSLRMPTFTDLYYSGPVNIGNPDLKPEQSLTLEGGLKVNKPLVRGHFILFYRQGNDMIDWVKKRIDEKWQPQNLTGLKSYGSEIRFEWFPREMLGEHWPDKWEVSYFFNQQEKEHKGLISNYVLDNLKHKFMMSLKQSITDNISLDLRGTYQDRNGTYSRFEEDALPQESPYRPFWLVDTKVNYQKGPFRFFVSARNLLNRHYFDLGNVIQPGRWIKTGVVYDLKFQ